MVSVFVVCLISGIVFYSIRQYDILGAIALLFAESLPIGICLMSEGPSGGPATTFNPNSTTLNSNQGGNSPTGSEAGTIDCTVSQDQFQA